jgi:DUF4097 and DUF4098 domain-containing protein YvlB
MPRAAMEGDSNMAGYPPPYPPTGSDWKAQRQAMKAQVRMQRQQFRMQRRALRRGSLVGPILLVALGVTFLLVELGRVSYWRVTEWFGHWWPVLLICAGVVLLAEWAIDQHVQQTRAAQGLPPTGSRVIGGGVIWLLVLVALLGGAAHVGSRTIDWDDNHFRFGLGDFDRALGDPHDSDDSIIHAISADGALTIDNPRGDVTVSGTSDDGHVHIAIHKQVFAFRGEDVDTRTRDLQPSISGEDGRLSVSVPSVESGHADLTVDLPRGVTLTVTADRGDVRVSSMHAPVTVNANRGSVDVSGVDGSVVAHLHNDDASFSAHSVTGPVILDGRTGDVNVSDVHGDVSLEGAASGSTHMERINGSVHFRTHRTDFQMARLDGQMDLDTGSDLSADQVLGPIILKTTDRNITLERVQGNVQVVNTNGSVTVTSASPLGAIDVSNRRGSVDVGVPASAGFVVQAATRHGEMENDFSLEKQGSEDSPELSATVGHGGPLVRIETTDGEVTLRKSAVDPLPAVVASPALKITVEPPVPAVPKAPKVKVPAPPAPPKS